MRTNKWLVGIASVLLTFGISAGAFATNSHGNKSDKSVNKNLGSIVIEADGDVALNGATVMAVTGSSVTAKVWNTNWTVNTTSSTKVTRKDGGSMTLADITINDIINVKGTMSETDEHVLTARSIKDRTLTRKTITGIIKSLTAPNLVMDKNKDDADTSDDVTVKTSTATSFNLGNVTKAFADLVAGFRVKVSGIMNSNTKLFTAQNVTIKSTDNHLNVTTGTNVNATNGQ